MQKRKVDEATWEKLQAKWPNMPLEELPKKEIATALAQMAAVLECVDQAARRPRYGSDLTPQNYVQILPTLPTQVMAFRTLMRLLVVRIRHQILEGDREGAIRSFQTGYAMARHCAEQPTVLNAVVGSVLIEIMNHQMTDLIQLPGSPNLYWAITALPEPMVDFQPVFDFESTVFDRTFPDVQRAKTIGATSDQWRAMLEKMLYAPPWQAAESYRSGQRVAEVPAAVRKQTIDTVLHKEIPIIRRILTAAGVSAGELDKISPAEMAVRAALEAYHVEHDELAKWYRIPYWQAEPHIEGQMAEIRGLLPEAAPWMERALEPVLSAKLAGQYKRGLAGLRCLEALRLYAAAHDKLPQSLEEITEVPIPVNPFTGKLFPYRAEDRYVILDLDGDRANYQWWIRLAD